MTRQKINVNWKAAPVGPFSHAIRAGDFIYVSGQGPIDQETGKIVGDTIEEQTALVLENIKTILETGGASLEDVVKANAYLSDIANFQRFNKVYASYFDETKPARTTIGCQPPIEGILIEIEVVAYVGSD